MDTIKFSKLPEAATNESSSQTISMNFSFQGLAPPWGSWGVEIGEEEEILCFSLLAPPWGGWGVKLPEGRVIQNQITKSGTSIGAPNSRH
jgi:hypothetical protein